jgi:HPP family
MTEPLRTEDPRERARRMRDRATAAVPPVSRPRPSAPGAAAPTARTEVAASLGVLRASLQVLRGALVLVAERHERNYEIWSTATVLAGWIGEDEASLDASIAIYGISASDQPHKLRAALLGGVRGGLRGTLADLTDLSILAQQVDMAWTIVFQGAKELEDKQLLAAAAAARNHTERVIRWIRTQIDHVAPEALAVGPDAGAAARASAPKGLDRIAAIPDPIWGPLASAALLLITGAAGLLVGRPWLLPSLGPTAVLAAEMPAHPASRPWNTIAGHLGGLLAGFGAVLITGAATQPVVLVDHVLTPPRVLASVLAIAMTVLLGALLRASHPPAAATTLLVSLGSLRTIDDALNLMAGVIVIAAVAELLRAARTQRVTPGERMAPAGSLVGRFLRPGPG